MDERYMDQRHMDERRNPAAVAAGGAAAVSWSAVLAGAVAAGAVSLLLFALATGLDLAALSSDSPTVASLTTATAIALIVIQWISACVGGYLTGRLRTRWLGTHTHEVFFRDTAHGFLTWCVATVFMASGLASAASTVMSGRAHVRTTVMPDRPAVTSSSGAALGSSDGEVVAIARDRAEGQLLLPEELSGNRLVPAQGMISYAGEARQRDAPLVAWQVSDPERKDAATISIFTALSMLVGAFIASVSAALGGRLRDLHP
jgi:hypothetical protein